MAIALSGAIASTVSARTWTSADGSKSFEGEIRSYDASTKTVSVLISGRVLAFQEEKLSDADATFLKEWETAQNAPKPEEVLASSVVGKKVLDAKLHRLEGNRFKRAEVAKTPEYYILYYSASW